MRPEPRYLFRRFVALIVDGILSALVAFVFTLPFVSIQGTDQLRFGNMPIKVYECGRGENITEEMYELIGKKPVEVNYCRSWVLGVDNGVTARIILSQSQKGKWTRTHEVTVPVGDTGVPVSPGNPDVPLGGSLMVVSSAAFLARAGRRTPGKALMGLLVGTAATGVWVYLTTF